MLSVYIKDFSENYMSVVWSGLFAMKNEQNKDHDRYITKKDLFNISVVLPRQYINN